MAVALALNHVVVPLLFAVMVQPIFDQFSAITRKSKMIFLKLVLKLMKAVHHMTLYWNEYISFAIVSHYCFLDKVFIPLKFRKE